MDKGDLYLLLQRTGATQKAAFLACFVGIYCGYVCFYERIQSGNAD